MAQGPLITSPIDIKYPPDLPITQRRDDLLQAISKHQVLIVAGETGSGKSTQLPKLCLELGLGSDGKFIGHTQPRRLAARTIAERVANELETEVGTVVGYKVRFDDRVKPSTQIKLMTDGVLLAETQRDRLLKKYDVIIIDEAHERSLNIDFILGYLKRILPKRPDLKVIVTSATIDTDRFSQHFEDAPIIEVSGRTYPVEIRYQPITAAQDTKEPNRNHNRRAAEKPHRRSQGTEQSEAIADAVKDLWIETDDDVLVFCSGEQEIRDAIEQIDDLGLPNTETLPLYARLSAAEQQRVFKSHKKRRVVVSTNVAETSVTVPGIRSVVDAGTARISRYSARTKVQRLPIEAISQASANQRAGRCGRLGPGICIRLFSEEDFINRDEFTEPEIQRTNLAAVILQMFSLKLGQVKDFPFVDPPDSQAITDGLRILEELDAVDPTKREGKLTPIGRTLAKIPIEPRLARMLLEADGNGSLREVLIIVAALAVADPRERPADKQQAAREAHAVHADPTSDFLTYLNLWDYLQTERRNKSSNQFRKQCRREFLNFLRIREWQATHKQLKQLCKDLKLSASSTPAKPDAIHQALLTGLLAQVGMKEVPKEKKKRSSELRKRRKASNYVGARNVKFSINPGSVLAKTGPQWVMAAELVETSQVWARTVCGVDPEWVCDAAAHMTKHSFGEPWWDIDRGVAMTTERVTLYGLTLVANRRTMLRRWSESEAREMFIHHALVLNEWPKQAYEFVAANAEVLAEADELLARQRSANVAERPDLLFRFFDERIPSGISNVGDFNGWWSKTKHTNPDILLLTVETLLGNDVQIDDQSFPTVWPHHNHELELAYEFDPSSNVDGVSVHVPVELLAELRAEPFEWSVPGFRNELVAHILRSLPKGIRKRLLPMSETTEWIQNNLEPSDHSMLEQIAQKLSTRSGSDVAVSDFNIDRVPSYLRPTFRVVNHKHEAILEGKDLDRIKSELASHTQQALARLSSDRLNADSLERTGSTQWDFGDLPESAIVTVDGHNAQTYPALFDEGRTVGVRLFATQTEQFDAMWEGLRRLLRIRLGSPVRQLDGLMTSEAKLWLSAPPIQSKVEWYNDTIDCVLDECVSNHYPLPRSAAGFDRLWADTENRFGSMLKTAASTASWFVVELSSLNRELENLPPSDARTDLIEHRDRLFYPGSLAGLGYGRIDDAVRYLTAMRHRLQNMAAASGRDRDNMNLCRDVENQVAQAIAQHGKTEKLEALIWSTEELRASVFSQVTAGTNQRVSAKKIRQQLRKAIAES